MTTAITGVMNAERDRITTSTYLTKPKINHKCDYSTENRKI